MLYINFSRIFEMRNISISNVSLSTKLIYIESTARINLTNIYFQCNVSPVLDGGFIRIENSLNINLNSIQFISSSGNQNIGIVIINQVQSTDKIAQNFEFNDLMQVLLIN